jgi:hypothetical protein
MDDSGDRDGALVGSPGRSGTKIRITASLDSDVYFLDPNAKVCRRDGDNTDPQIADIQAMVDEIGVKARRFLKSVEQYLG